MPIGIDLIAPAARDDFHSVLGAPVYTSVRRNTAEKMPIEENRSKLSYARGPASPLLELTIGDLLHRTAERFGDREAAVSCHQSRRLTCVSPRPNRPNLLAVLPRERIPADDGNLLKHLHAVPQIAHPTARVVCPAHRNLNHAEAPFEGDK